MTSAVISNPVKDLKEQSQQVFSKKSVLNSLFDEMAMHFYPERRGFTGERSIADDFAGELTTSFPILARRDLANSLDAMLRSGDWFSIITNRGVEDKDNAALRWLQAAQKTQYRAMYDRKAKFQRATREGSNDYTTFGQYVMSVEVSMETLTLLYRTWHLKDVAWCENENGDIDVIHRKWRPTARELKRMFKDKVHEKVAKLADSKPYDVVNCEHVVMDINYYDNGRLLEPYKNMKAHDRPKWASAYIDMDNGQIMSELPSFVRIYVIPRWQTVSGSPYAFSPATIAAIPDARLIQAMTLTLLEAGEKSVNPPAIARTEILRSDLNLLSGGVTTIDPDYDDRQGKALEFLTTDKSGLNFGISLRNDIRNQLSEAFYLNKIMLPEITKEMTAFETKKRMEEYARQALPIFQPAEAEENGAICEMTFELLMRSGAFGRVDAMPDSLQGQDISFSFQSPLQEAAGQVLAQRFIAARGLLVQVGEEDPGALNIMDVRTAVRETLTATIPATWINDEKKVAAMDEQHAQQAEMANMVNQVNAGATAAEQVGKAGVALRQAQAPM